MTGNTEQAVEWARELTARYFENDPLDRARKAVAEETREGRYDDQDAVQIALYARRAILAAQPSGDIDAEASKATGITILAAQSALLGEGDCDQIRRSIIRQLGDNPDADRIILPGTDWDIVLRALRLAPLPTDPVACAEGVAPIGEPIPTDPGEAMGWRAQRAGVSLGEVPRKGYTRPGGWEAGHRARSAWIRAGRPAAALSPSSPVEGGE